MCPAPCPAPGPWRGQGHLVLKPCDRVAVLGRERDELQPPGPLWRLSGRVQASAHRPQEGLGRRGKGVSPGQDACRPDSPPPGISPRGAYRPDEHCFHTYSRCSMEPIRCHIRLPKGRGAGRPRAFASAAWTALRCPSHDSSPARGLSVSAFSPHSGLGHLYSAGRRSGPVAASTAVSRGRVVLVVRDQRLGSAFRALARSPRVSAFAEVGKRPEHFHPLEIAPEEPQ